MFENSIKTFKTVATMEGISFLVLLFIAMPLKYMFDFPIANKIVGMIHGGLFLWFIKAQWDAHKDYNFSLKFNILAFISSLLPFATFFLKKELDKIEPKQEISKQ